ncbi:MAG TPA: hypothetical protein VN700_00045 [Vicinamibacterales bacterium]|nr:hypothetical protein [Vicinamibacterales bacterium]
MNPHDDNRDRPLTGALRRVAEDDDTAGASPAVRARLLNEVRSIARARRRTSSISLAAAALVMLGVGYMLWRAVGPSADGTPDTSTAGVRAEVTTPFFPLISTTTPLTSTHIVRIEVPRRALASFGLAAAEAAEELSSGTVLADVAIGDDGLARAVRFVRPSTPEEKQP